MIKSGGQPPDYIGPCVGTALCRKRAAKRAPRIAQRRLALAVLAQQIPQTTQPTQGIGTRQQVQPRHRFGQLAIVVAAEIVARQPQHRPSPAHGLLRGDVQFTVQGVEQIGLRLGRLAWRFAGLVRGGCRGCTRFQLPNWVPDIFVS